MKCLPIGVDESLKQIAYRYKKNGLKGAVEICRELLDSSPTDDDLVAIDEFALHFLHTAPSTSIRIATDRLDRFSDRSSGVGWSVLAAAYCQQGRESDAVESCRFGLTKDIPLRMRINLLGILTKYEDISSELPSLLEAYDPNLDGLDIASKLYQLAIQYAYWIEAEKLLGLIKQAYVKGQVAEISESPRLNLLWCGDQKINTEVARHMTFRQGLKPRDSFVQVKKRHNFSDERIHIGYLSSDFRDHPTSHLMMGCWRNHDRAKFRITMFDSGWDDGSTTRSELVSYGDEIVPVAALTDKQAAEEIKKRHVDILIELNGPTQSHRLGILSFRPAPILIGYLGWAGSYGGLLVDHIIADEYVLPRHAASEIPESVLHLSGTYQINDHKNYSVFKGRFGRKGASLKHSEKFIFGSINDIQKLNLEVWDVWMHILQQCPSSELHLLHPGIAAVQNIVKITRRYNISPSRLRWLPKLDRAEHLLRLSEIDLILDSWPYGGHTTTSDALASGVPVLTLEGTNFAGRVCGSLLKAAGLGATLIAESPKDYANIACSLYSSPQHMEQISDFMSEHLASSRLFDSVARTRELESIFAGLLHA